MLRLLPLLLVFLVIQTPLASSEDDPCDPRALLPPTDPAHAEAMKLSKTLNRHGIQMRCILLSKEAQMFEGQLGAAFFRTDTGDFEALFLPPSRSWDKLKVIEQRETAGRAKYRFQGSPTYSGTWEGKSVFFFKRDNRFLHSLDQQLISKLREVLQQD